jgi:hypothetical protein
MIETRKHMDGRNVVIGAVITKVPKGWRWIEDTLNGVEVEIVYDPTEPDESQIYVLVNGCDVYDLLSEHGKASVQARVDFDVTMENTADRDSALELMADDIMED